MGSIPDEAGGFYISEKGIKATGSFKIQSHLKPTACFGSKGVKRKVIGSIPTAVERYSQTCTGSIPTEAYLRHCVLG